MSIVVFYLHQSQSPEPEAPSSTGTPPAADTAASPWLPRCQSFSDAQMSEALAWCQQLRGDPRNAHVTISSELRDMVGPVGVAAVENGHTPDGQAYEWSKAGRAGASRKAAQQPPVTREQMDR